MTVETRARFVAVVVIMALAAVAYTGGSQQAQPAPQAPEQQFRATATLVEVDAIVTDRSGQFVDGLTIEDFEVLEEGERQQIQILYQVEGTTVKSMPGAATAAPTAAAPGTVQPPASSPQRVFVLYFDDEHVDAGEFKRLQSAAEQFLSTEFRSGDVGGLLVGARMAGNQLTTNREVLLAAVRQAKPNADQRMRKLDTLDWPRMSEIEAVRIALRNDKDVLDQVVRRAQQEGAPGRLDLTSVVMEKARYTVDQLRPAAARTVATLQGLMKGLARLPGRKTVVLMSDGFFIEESWASLRQIVGEAARSNVRIYGLDAMGLRRADRSTDLNQMNPLETGASIPLDAYNTVEDGPNTLAFDTGGYVIRHTNEFGAALAEIARDTSRYYVLGYSPTNTTMDGKFRQIAVRVRRDGVRVRARRGYLAAATPPGATPAAPKPAPTPAGVAEASPPIKDVPPVSPPAPSARPAPEATADAPLPPPISPLPLRPDVGNRVRALAERAAVATAAKSLASEGWDRYAKGDLEGARDLLSRAAAQPGAPPWVSYALGFAQLGLGKPEEAARSWERVRAAVPEFAAVYLDLADAYLQQDSPGQAAEVLRAAARHWPADVDVLNALGTVQVRRASLNDAIDLFQNAIAAQPKDSLAYLNLARTYELRYYKTRRFSRTESHWIDNPADLKRALENYERYLDLGGPYAADARAAIERLRWVK